MNSRRTVQKEIGHRTADTGNGARRRKVSGRRKAKEDGKEENGGKLKTENEKGKKEEGNK
jgi:hypothetical protein